MGNEAPAEICDLLIVGSGAAGMAAAITAAHHGLNPLIVEKSEYFGGSTAVSGGAIWIPNNPLMHAAGLEDSAEAARMYIEAETGNRMNAALVDAFLREGPEAIGFFHEKTALRFTHRAFSPDYHPDTPGAALGGRVIDAEDYDGRRLGDKLKNLRPPIADFTLFGGMMLNRFDIGHFLKMTRSPRSALHAASVIMRYAKDRLTHGRGTRLVLGAAIAGRLAETVFDLGIPLHLRCALVGLVKDGAGGIIGARVRGPDGERFVQARHGVVLASGGFPHDPARRSELFGHVSRGIEHFSMSPTAGEGEAIRLAESIGARFVASNSNPAFWTPVSLLPNGDGTKRPFPHLFLDRAKPGVIAVSRNGRRFVNEASSYHDFVQGLVAMLLEEGEKSAWLICDHHALRRYGLGAVPAFPGWIAPYLKSGYLKRGGDLRELAAATGIDEATLEKTVFSFNADAIAGSDRVFGKGSTVYQTYLGDADNKPNPCLRPLETAPYYAIEIFPGDIGTSMGLLIDEHGRVLDDDGQAIDGLFACGNDANSIMAGAYPGAGITLGPAITFGYIVGKSAAKRPDRGP
ncbi:FAD-dependent oxidoreductase [Aquamicrobium sp. LC103]|uniref:FAD-dependent oxidoreductase n=1 Tax=Aquamicrobium sp. LC103 TaxID=1120658 RepID=UPI00063E7FAF|nr:FAD-dependent oxidoreductase [Aquamicrobium sp. LC103]TKT78277.1 FAD-dependent oxidoreductase [Aquamicrobium sp. LC103]